MGRSGFERETAGKDDGTSAPVDYVIITALEEERAAVLETLREWRKLDQDDQDVHVYYEAFVQTGRRDGARYRVIVTSMSGMGPIKAASKAKDVVARWHPPQVLLVGIAGGIAGEVRPGDVVVSSQIADYSLGKQGPDGQRHVRWEVFQVDGTLFAAADNYASGWEALVQASRPEPGTPALAKGVIASGGDVIALPALVATYREVWGKLVAVEMEGGGLAAALHESPVPARFLMIRGISDLADGKGNARVKARWRSYACHTAAGYAIGLLQEGPTPAQRSGTVPAVPAPMSNRPASVSMRTPDDGESPDPFVVGPPIGDPRGFYGRAGEIKRLTGLFVSRPAQHAVIVGPPRSGKTSLLLTLRALQNGRPVRPDQAPLRDARAGEHRWVYVDFHDSTLSSQAGLCQRLLEGLGLPLPLPLTAESFMATVRSELVGRAVIMFDEIGHALTHYEELDDVFWKAFRSLVTVQTGGRVSLVVASHLRFEHLAETTGHDSPLANIFGYTKVLGPLDEHAAIDLVRSGPLQLPPEEEAWILRESGRWPVLLQVLCRERLALSDQPEDWQSAAREQAAQYSHLLR